MARLFGPPCIVYTMHIQHSGHRRIIDKFTLSVVEDRFLEDKDEELRFKDKDLGSKEEDKKLRTQISKT